MGDHGGRVLFLQQKNEGFFSGSLFFLIQDRKEEQKMRIEKVWVFAAFAVFAGICTGCRSTATKTAGTWEPKKIEISSLQTADESGQCFGILVGRGGEEEAFYSPKNGATRNIIGSLEDLQWVARRGGAGIWEPARQAQEEELGLIREMDGIVEPARESEFGFYELGKESKKTWVRMFYRCSSETEAPAGGDVIVASEGKDAFLAFCPQEGEDWEVIWLPEYGQWLEREVDLYLRMATGL